MKGSLVLPLIACLAVGCGIDFSSPMVDTAASLAVSVAIADTLPTGQIQLRGSLWPGYDAAGSVRAMGSSSLEVLGRTVGPYAGSQTDSAGAIGYSEDWPLTPGTPLGLVELRGPEIPGIGPAPVFRLTPPWPTGPESITVPRDSALRLDLSVAPEPGDTVYEFWRLDLLSDGREVSQLNATGPTPASIEVPRAMLAGLEGAGQARLTVSQGVSSPRDGRAYAARLGLVATHVWHLTVQP